jgi:hypothetical protein
MLEVPKASNTSENSENLNDKTMDNQQETKDILFYLVGSSEIICIDRFFLIPSFFLLLLFSPCPAAT